MSLEERLKAALADRYRIEGRIGRGGMATVYLAEDFRHKRKVAVKVLDPELGAAIGPERFLREIETVASLTHPHILPLHDSGEADGLLYYVMPYAGGDSLREVLDREQQLPVEDALRYAREMVGALAYAHNEGIVHRDVKPANILLEAGHAVLSDFGIAHAAAGVKEERLTQTGTSLGTPAYMSPEQVAGDASLDARTDQYALACVLYEMLVGEPPFTGVNAAQILAKKLSESPASISALRPTVNPQVDGVVRRAVATLPADRFPTIRAFGDALEDTLRPPISTGSTPQPEPGPLEGRRSRGSMKWLASTAAVAGLVFVGGFLLLGSTDDLGFQERDWILLTDVENNTGDSIFDRSLNNALTVGLQQSRHVNVFPRSRVAQTLARMLREDTVGLDEALGREIALRENIELLVVPSIDRIDGTYLLAIRVLDPSTGEDLLSRSSQAQGASEVVPALDRLARDLRRHLGESRFSIQWNGVPLGQATTPSLEALEAWSQGQFHSGLRRYTEAVGLYQRALELDSAFAMAHQALGATFFQSGNREQGLEHFERARFLADRVTERERLWILAEIENWKQNYGSAIDAYNIYLTRYPDDLDGWFRLGYAHMREGNRIQAIQAFQRVVEIDPESEAGLINLATSYNLLNRREEALGYYLKAFELAPAWRTSGNLNHEFGMNFVEMGRLREAEAVFREMLDGNQNQQAQGNRSLALMKMFQGRYRDAQDHLREAILVHQALSHPLSEYRDRRYLAVACFAVGDTSGAWRELEAIDALAKTSLPGPGWLAYLGKIQARNGLVEEALVTLARARQQADESIEADRIALVSLEGEIALAQGASEEALALLRRAATLLENSDNLESVAQAHYRAGNLAQAGDLFSELLAEMDLGWEAQEYWLQAHYHLGRIHEAQGDTAAALRQYQALLEIWQDGDEDIVIKRLTEERVHALVEVREGLTS